MPRARTRPGDALRDDLVSALINLGYHRQAIDKTLERLLSTTPNRASKTSCAPR